jgi:hypothetical protein
MSRIKQKKLGNSNYLEFTNQNNTLANFGFDGSKFSLDKPLTVTGAVTSTGAITATALSVTSTTMSTPLVTTPVGTVAITEYGDGRDMTTTLTLTNFVVGALAGAGAALALGNIVAAFPAGVHTCKVAYQSLSMKCAGTAVNSDTGLGSVIGSGAQAALSAVGATSEDYLTGQTLATAAAGGAVGVALVDVSAAINLNVAASVKNVFLNSAGTWNANNTGNLTATGTVVLKWTKIA